MTAPTDQTAPAQPSAGPRLRASDAERAAAVHRLHEAVTQGRLTLEECAERTEAAHAARFVDELPALTADLPDPVPVAPGWRPLASAAALQFRSSLLGAPSWSAASRWRRRAVVVGAVLLVLLLAALVTAGVVSAADGPRLGGPPYWHDRFDHPGPP